ncbi:VacJ family lipoprotein [Phaeovulum sp.]|uniref:MlaA family lipoprotein n=1 Tax=Phaeovulum sp. TaxID=2934796 RepID=UPI0039E38556
MLRILWSRFLPRRQRHTALAGCALLVLAACASAPAPVGVSDPYEAQNRQVHDFNVALDKALFMGSGTEGATTGVPEPVLRTVSNFGGNLGLPGKVVNSILQGRPEPAVKNTFRFLINSTLGVAGIFDPAGSSFSLPETYTDFGETLHVWGVGEGAYLELPVLGPSTERDLVGTVVDIVIDPLRIILPEPETYYATGARLASKVSDRLRFGDTIDSILHESADSYAQSRLLYLQNRRYQLGTQSVTDADAYDPYEDPYGQ